MIDQEVVYDWLPVKCEGCVEHGHTLDMCRKNKPKKVWRPKVIPQAAAEEHGRTEGV